MEVILIIDFTSQTPYPTKFLSKMLLINQILGFFEM